MDEQDPFELIDSYLRGELSEKEIKVFEDRISSDPSFAEELRLRKHVIRTVVDQKVPAFREKVRLIRQQMHEDEQQRSKPGKVIYSYRLAAVIVLLVVTGLVIYFYSSRSGKDSEALFASHFTPHSYTVRSNETLSQGFMKYQEADYKAALTIFQEDADSTKDMRIYFYIGNCYLAINETEQAISAFQTVINDTDNLCVQPSKWYLALAYLKNGDMISAKEILQLLNTESGIYKRKADGLLKELATYPSR